MRRDERHVFSLIVVHVDDGIAKRRFYKRWPQSTTNVFIIDHHLRKLKGPRLGDVVRARWGCITCLDQQRFTPNILELYTKLVASGGDELRAVMLRSWLISAAYPMWTLLLSLAFGLSHSPVCTFEISLEMGMLLFSDVAHNSLRSWYSILFILTLLQRYEHYPTECLDYSRVTLPSFEHDSSKGLHSLDSHLIFVTGQCLEF